MDTSQDGECAKDDALNFLRATQLCAVELARIMLGVFKTALVLPLLKKAVGAVIARVDADGSGEVSLVELQTYCEGLLAPKDDDAPAAEVPLWQRMATGGHLDKQSKQKILGILDETQILGMIVRQAIQMAGCGGLDLESFSDMSSHMMANQLDLLITITPSLPDQNSAPEALKRVLELCRGFSQKVRDKAADSTECLIQKYFDFLDRDSGGLVDQQEFDCAIELMDPKLDPAVKISSLFKLLDVDGDGQITFSEAYSRLACLVDVVAELFMTLLDALEDLVTENETLDICEELIQEYFAGEAITFDDFPGAFQKLAADFLEVLRLMGVS
eukprot:TRINITY_DN7535_c0_g2_i2.p2 TRINITY_DN7535_c0_g2~~TRINITY_DN7535_c0_g2_i2.p2  ORF type:complete len:330 (-),score=105.27 TRINITY_DN7535_c0_g2_i2:587-1576(-)